MSLDEMCAVLEEYTSEEVVRVVCDINGYSAETLEDILYAVTGYRSFDQLSD